MDVLRDYEHLDERFELLRQSPEFQHVDAAALYALGAVMRTSAYPSRPQTFLAPVFRALRVDHRTPPPPHRRRRRLIDWIRSGLRTTPLSIEPQDHPVEDDRSTPIHPPDDLSADSVPSTERILRLARSRTLAVVASGEVRLLQRWRGLPYERTVGPGRLFGEGSVVATAIDAAEAAAKWFDLETFEVLPEPPSHHRSMLLDTTRLDISSAAIGPVVVLEADPYDVRALFGEHPTLAHAIAHSFESVTRAPEVVEVMTHDRTLEDARREDLFALIEGLPIQDVPSGTEIAALPSDVTHRRLHVILQGDVERVGEGLVLDRRVLGLDVAGHRTWADGERYRALTDLTYLTIPELRLHQISRSRPMLGRVIRHAVASSPPNGVSQGLEPTKDITKQDVVLVVGHYEYALLWGDLTGLVGEALAEHLGDRTCVLYLVGDPSLAHDDRVTMLAPARPDCSSPKTLLHARWLVVGEDPTNVSAIVDHQIERLLAEIEEDDQNKFDVVLLHTANLTIEQRRALPQLTTITTVAYVTGDPADPELAELSRRATELVPVGLLGSKAPSDEENPKAFVARAATSLAERLLRRLRPAFPMPSGKTPWPAGTVRARLLDGDPSRPPPKRRPAFAAATRPGAVWAAQLETADDRTRPENIDDTDRRERQELRETIYRIARAVTGRRVGVALGADDGALGYAHAVLLMELHGPTRQIPVDIVSGSDLGAVVATYFVAGDPKFDRLRGHPEFARLASSPLPVGQRTIMSLAVDLELGRIDLNDLEVTLLPVVPTASTGLEVAIREGTIGEGIRLSSSPPTELALRIGHAVGPRDIEPIDRSPVEVLHDEGAGLVIPSCPILGPTKHQRLDFERQEDLMNAARVEPEQRLKVAAERAEIGWRSLLRHPPRRVSLREETTNDGEVGKVGVLVAPEVVFQAFGPELRLTRTDVLSEIVRFTLGTPTIRKVSFRVAPNAISGFEPEDFVSVLATRMIRLEPEMASLVSEKNLSKTLPTVPAAVQFEVQLFETPSALQFERVRARLARGGHEALQSVPQPDLRLARLLGLESARMLLSDGLRNEPRPANLGGLSYEDARRIDDPEVLNLLRDILEVKVRLRRKWNAKNDAVGPAEYSPAGDRVAIGNVVPGAVTIAHDHGDEEHWRFEELDPSHGPPPRVVDLAWSAEGRLAAALQSPRGEDHDGFVVWPTPSVNGPVDPAFTTAPNATRIAFHPDGLLVTRRSGVWLYPWRDEAPVEVHRDARGVRVAPDGVRLVTLGADGAVHYRLRASDPKRYEIHAARPLAEGTGSAQSADDDLCMTDAAWSPHGEHLAVAVGSVLTVWWFDDNAMAQHHRILRGSGRSVGGLVWSNDGRMLAASGDDGKIRLWNVEDGLLQDVLPFSGRPQPACLSFSPTRPIVGLITNKRFYAWSSETGRLQAEVDGFGCTNTEAPRFSWHPSGHRVLVCDGQVRESGFAEELQLDLRGEPVYAAEWQPDLSASEAPTMAYATFDGRVGLWRPTSPVSSRTILEANGALAMVQWHPAGRRLAIAREHDLFVYDLDRRRVTHLETAIPDREPGTLDTYRGLDWLQGDLLFLRTTAGWRVVKPNARGRFDAVYDRLDVHSMNQMWRNGRGSAFCVSYELAPAGTNRATSYYALCDVEAEGARVRVSPPVQGECIAAAVANDGTSIVAKPHGYAVAKRGSQHLDVDHPNIKSVSFRPRAPGHFAMIRDQALVLAALPEAGAPPPAERVLLTSEHRLQTFAWSPQGDALAVGDATGRVHLWLGESLQPMGFIHQLHRHPILGLRWRPDAQQVASWSTDGLRIDHVEPKHLIDGVGAFGVESHLTTDQWDEWMAWTGSAVEDWPTWPKRTAD